MKSDILLITAAFLAPMGAWAANCDGTGNCYVRAGATGNGNGSSWTNACPGLAGTCAPSNMTRGVTYWIAAGSYGGADFSAADSGTTVISILGATALSHGPASDWSPSYAGVAKFGAISFASDYWTINGQSRGADWKSAYSIKFQSAGNNSQCIYLPGRTGITLSYIECQGYSPVGPSIDDAGIYGSATNFYLGYSYIHDVGDTQFQQNTGQGNNMTYEYNWVSNDGMCGTCNHFEAYSITATNLIVRYNVFENIVSTGVITDASGGGASVGNWEIYGNIFFWDPGLATKSGWPQLVDLDDGVVVLLGNNYSGHFYFYNNTIEGISPNVPANNNCNLSAFGNPGGYSVSGVTFIVQNNLWVNNGANVYGGCQWNTPIGISGYNAYAGGNNGALNADPGDSSNVQLSSTNLLVSASPTAIADFKLSKDTTTGIALAAPWNFDGFNQLTRGASGVWDRGAAQFFNSSGTTPQPPTGVTSAVH